METTDEQKEGNGRQKQEEQKPIMRKLAGVPAPSGRLYYHIMIITPDNAKLPLCSGQMQTGSVMGSMTIGVCSLV